MKKFLFYSVIIFIVIYSFHVNTLESQGKQIIEYKTGKPITNNIGDYLFISNEYIDKQQELRGVWVATISNIDIKVQNGITEYDIETYKSEFIEILETMKSYHMNAIFFQVRPANDAFYQSNLNPWSRYLIGKEGTDPGWDPLAWMIETTHLYGIEFHAWFNPYRIINSTKLNKETYLNTLHEMNFARKNPDLVLEIKDGKGTSQLILNPGELAVQEFIIDSVMEVVQNYHIDAVHFDDYFYPYKSIGNIDLTTYKLNNPYDLNVDDWRRENVNRVIKGIKDQLNNYNHKQVDRYVEFGISPFGIWANESHHSLGSPTNGLESYYIQYADTYKWIKEGWIDYIIPQIYWDFSHPYAPYADLINWWSNVVHDTQVKLYIGLALYRYGESGNWLDENETAHQLLFNQNFRNIKGNVFYSYRHLVRTDNQLLIDAREKINILYKNSNPLVPSIHTQMIPINLVISQDDHEVVIKWEKKSEGYRVYHGDYIMNTSDTLYKMESVYEGLDLFGYNVVKTKEYNHINQELIQFMSDYKPLYYEVHSQKPNWLQGLNSDILNDQLVIIDDQIDMSSVGTYHLKVSLVNKHIEMLLPVNIVDTTKPVIYNQKDYIVPINSKNINWYDHVVAMDNYDGDLSNKIMVDDSRVDLSKAGNYPVFYEVIDANGNHQVIQMTVKVVDKYNMIPFIIGSSSLIFLFISVMRKRRY